MANKKISQLQTVSELDGTEVLPIVQGGTTKKVTAQAIADLGGAGGGAVSFNIIADGTVLSNTQTVTIRQSASVSNVSGNQTITAETYPEIYIGNGATATTITLTNLPTAGLMISNAQSLLSVSLPDFVTPKFGGMVALSIQNNPSLTTISFPLLANIPNGTWYDYSGNALSQATVDYILDKFATGSAPSTNGQYTTLYLHSGTNATPSAAGLASKAILVGKGWTVQHN
jgi:hypothetical protein